MFVIEEIYLDNIEKKTDVVNFLDKFNLEYENDIDYSIAVYDNGNIIATASKAKNVLKCFAILDNYQGLGITNSLVKNIEDRMFKEGLYHFFIFTPSYNQTIFTNFGYQEIITSNGITILENGNQNIKNFLSKLKENNNLTDCEKACIIMNGNPFTNGHLYLIEETARENDCLLVFVVTENKSSFPFSTRMRLIKEGTKHINNVVVLETGPYLISNATFPTYFLKKNTDIVTLQTKIDCELFVTYYKSIFNITKRYIGTEPYCEVTRTYNEMMKKILPENGIDVIEINRKKALGYAISASKVRRLIKSGDISQTKSLVPKTTYDYLTSKEALPIISQIKQSKGRH
ncbi:[citrate (pro-3S)-lyase] ligase [Mycoplasmatota bacterium]|nr:[citrate (pro-3S)-lyase] ligase [Mycoplasmatota bacterium]